MDTHTGTEQMLASFDGIQLHCRLDLPESPQAMVIIVHGLCEHLGRYDHLAAMLVENGMGALRFSHRGHGHSGGPRASFNDYTQYMGDIAAVVQLAKAQWPGLPLFLYGHSLGGNGVALYVSHNPGAVRGAIISSGIVRNTAGKPEHIPVPDNPEGYIKNPLKGGICGNPAFFDAVRADPQMQRRVHHGVFPVVDSAVQWLKANPRCFADPVLILQGAQDGFVGEQDARDLYGEIASEDKTLFIYGGLMHELLNEADGPEVMADILRWLKKHL